MVAGGGSHGAWLALRRSSALALVASEAQAKLRSKRKIAQKAQAQVEEQWINQHLKPLFVPPLFYKIFCLGVGVVVVKSSKRVVAQFEVFIR